MPSQFSKGYQAALADITAAMESAVTGDAPEVDNILVIEAVEAWIDNNTISNSKSQMYRGYWIQHNEESNSFEIYSSPEDGAGLIDLITFQPSLKLAKSVIDKWVNAR